MTAAFIVLVQRNEGPLEYELDIKNEAMAAIRKLSAEERRAVGFRLFCLQKDFSGDVKKLKGSKNEYRLRVGDLRVLFEVEGKRLVVYAIGNRKDIYK